MKNILILLLFICTLNCFASESYIVEFGSRPTAGELKKIRKYKGIEAIEKFDSYENDYFNRLYKVTAKSVDNINFKEITIKKIEWIREISSLSNESTGPDLFKRDQWALDNIGQSLLQEVDDINTIKVEGVSGQDIGLAKIQKNLDGQFKKEVVVAILDSGISLDHEDLKDSIYKNTIECDENGEIKYKPKEDLDENGYNGDCMGWDFTAKGKGSNKPLDNKGHGTHISGIIAAQINNDTGIAGVSNKIKILPIKVLKSKEGKSGAIGLTDRIAKGLLYAIKMKVDVINLSLGWPKAMDTEYLRNAIKEANDNGIIVVAAAGNNNTNKPIYPCSYENVICVGAITNNGQFASFSNFGGMVDVLAPGDQILSTIPKKITPEFFSVEGYDYKNGTSQAAPYVSAAAAVLKGINPKRSKNDILAALINSSSSSLNTKDEEKFSISGLINIEKAINQGALDVLYPNFKNLHILDVDVENKTFKIELPVMALNNDIKDIEVEIFVTDKNIKLDKNQFEIKEIKKSESSIINVEGRVLSLDGHANSNIVIKLKYSGITTSFKKDFVLARQLKGDKNLIKRIVNKENIKDEIVRTVKGRMIPLVRTVKDKYRVHKNPEYYILTRGKEANSLKILDTINEEMQLKKIDLPNVTQILGVYKYDLNYDGVADYFVRSMANDKDAEKGKEKHILFSYLDENLKPLMGNQSHFRFYPEVVIMKQPEKINFIPMNTKYGKIAIPLFIESGGIPEADKDPDPWTDEDLTKKKHAYYYKLNFEKNIFETRLFDNYKFIDYLKNSLSIKWFHEINLMGLLAQSLDMLTNGQSKFHLAIGDGFNKNIYEVKIKLDLAYDINPLFTSINLEGYYGVPVTYLSDTAEYFKTSSFTTLQSETMAHFVLLDELNSNEIEADFTYVHERKKDHILGVMSSFRKKNDHYTFLQSKGNIVLNLKTSDDIKTFTQKIHRSSFLPGSLFNEIFYPVVSGQGDSLAPGFYIDATQLHSGHIYFLKATQNGFVSPIKNNIFIPENCVSLNPIKFGETESYALICKNAEGQVEFNYLEIN